MTTTCTPLDEFISRRRYKTRSDGSTSVSKEIRLEASSDTATPYVFEANEIANWHRFLDQLVKRQVVEALHVEAVRTFWKGMARLYALTAPSSTVTEDGAIQLAWNSSKHHVEVDILPDGNFEWLYVNRENHSYEGSDEPISTVPRALFDAFSLIFG